MTSADLRVAVAPAAVAALTKKGFTVQIQENAGAEASFTNDMFAEAGAKIVDKKTAYGSGEYSSGSVV